MRTKFKVGQAVYLPCTRTQSVNRHTISSILITCSKPGEGGPYGSLWSEDCEVAYRLSSAQTVHEGVLFERPEDAFRHIDAMTAAAPASEA